MADRLRVTELDFDTIKANLREFLKQQDEFTDYDFEGAGLSILLDILAYNTHYNAYYLNMVANEAFLDTALLRDSIVSHAKTLGYTPSSRKAAVATINMTAYTEDSTPGSLTIPEGYAFLSNKIDGRSYTFSVLDDVTVEKNGTAFYFEGVNIHQGVYTEYKYVHDASSNPKQIFTIPDENIDTSTIKVTVSPSVSNTNVESYTYVSDILEVGADSPVYFLQEERKGNYQIYFGNDVIGKKLPDGALVTIRYLITDGADANGAEVFVPSLPIVESRVPPISHSDFEVTTVARSANGSDKDTSDRIKYLAPLQYVSQNRIVTKKDYELYVKKAYPNLDSISVWGGEEETPPVFGKVFISLKPRDGYFISETEKNYIINEIINKRSVITLRTDIVEPEYVYLTINTNVQYNKNKTKLTEQVLKNRIRNAVIFYRDTFLNNFSTKFVLSKLDEYINDVDLNAIVGCESLLSLQKRITPQLGVTSNYSVKFNASFAQSFMSNKFSTSAFNVYDVNGVLRTVTLEEVPKSISGINAINIVNSGLGYTSTPTVTITGDGTGASAVAVLANGRIQQIKIVDPGSDYTQATVTITGGGGYGGEATPVIDYKTGTLRAVYFNSDAEKVILNPAIGLIDYDAGLVTVNDLNIASTDASDGLIRFTCAPRSSIIQSVRNMILTIDDLDPTSIQVSLEETE